MKTNYVTKIRCFGKCAGWQIGTKQDGSEVLLTGISAQQTEADILNSLVIQMNEKLTPDTKFLRLDRNYKITIKLEELPESTLSPFVEKVKSSENIGN